MRCQLIIGPLGLALIAEWMRAVDLRNVSYRQGSARRQTTHLRGNVHNPSNTPRDGRPALYHCTSAPCG